ncbi:hypothetical protein COOONC_09487 [Cooperia oncophora]
MPRVSTPFVSGSEMNSILDMRPTSSRNSKYYTARSPGEITATSFEVSQYIPTYNPAYNIDKEEQ